MSVQLIGDLIKYHLHPFEALWRRSKSPATINELKAYTAMLDLYNDLLSEVSAPERPEDKRPTLQYTWQFESLYLALYCGQYCRACHELCSVPFTSLENHHMYSTLMMLLQEVSKGVFPMPWSYSHSLQPSDASIAMERILNHPDYIEADNGGKIAFLRFVMQAIKTDILGSSALNVVFEENTENWDVFPVVSVYRDLGISKTDKRLMEFGTNTVYSLPTSLSDTIQAAGDIAKEGFRSSEAKRYNGQYFPELNLIMISNGHHHSSVASMATPQQGCALLDVYPLAPIYDNLNVDQFGKEWHWSDDKGQAHKQPVFEPRFALLYSVAREIHLLEKEPSK